MNPLNAQNQTDVNFADGHFKVSPVSTISKKMARFCQINLLEDSVFVRIGLRTRDLKYRFSELGSKQACLTLEIRKNACQTESGCKFLDLS